MVGGFRLQIRKELPFSIARLYESCFLNEPLIEAFEVLGEILGDERADDFSIASCLKSIFEGRSSD